jgi:hypothetical protein
VTSGKAGGLPGKPKSSREFHELVRNAFLFGSGGEGSTESMQLRGIRGGSFLRHEFNF